MKCNVAVYLTDVCVQVLLIKFLTANMSVFNVCMSEFKGLNTAKSDIEGTKKKNT